MAASAGVRLSLLKFLYGYTILGAGLAGLWVVVSPGTFASAFGMPAQDPFVLGVAGACWAAFGAVAALGLRAPLAFAPVFLIQLGYKGIWLALVFFPMAVRGPVPFHAWALAAIFASYVLLDLVAVPFGRLFEPARGEPV